MLAGFLGWPQATFASKLLIEKDRCVVTREVDGGLETIAVQRPCVVTTDLRLNTPRYIPLPNILKARSKPLVKKPVEDFAVNLVPQLRTIRVEPPQVREAGQTFTELNAFLETLDKDGVLR